MRAQRHAPVFPICEKGRIMKFTGKNITIGKTVSIGKEVKIGDNTIIYDNVIIGDNTLICNDCVIGEPTNSYYYDEGYQNPPTFLGANSLIRSHAIIYAGTKISDHFTSGHRIIIREKTTMGRHCSVGTFCDIQGYSTFGNYCRLHSSVHIGQNSRVGNFVFIYPYAVFLNDPTPPSNSVIGPKIGDYSQVGASSVVFPGIVVGENCLVAAGSVVNKDVASFSVVAGNPARSLCRIEAVRSRERDGSHYPWMLRYEKGMPWAGCGYPEWIKQTNSKP